MINIKPIIYKKLKEVTDNVTDTYPQDWENFPVIIYLEEENKPYEITDDTEQMSYLRYKVDIFHNDSTSELAVAIDAIFASLGLKRTSSVDTPDPTHLRHKVMRFEGILDLNSRIVYQYRMEG
ncbi:hypothetical protein [Streptococcus suis]|uniref:Phage protein n=1 Tax=Streptococcus suis TaxID=1307 RepID=A0A426G4X3_STRSU|nr:hypothetical protein [Streptococcus suis]MCQ8264152.1 hypothetical protein [Streptococcus suis]MCQ8265177.1 hypothetical protein [Streptococcus suis]MDW8717944.1 hypothetical protein [Streptococcus suis]MDW8766655.1 hypothetical protein [Streptococcus suis]NQJ20738.1 hypothetical protein [Streptococcus suis]